MNPAEDKLDETLRAFRQHCVQGIMSDTPKKLTLDEAKAAILKNFISREEVAEALGADETLNDERVRDGHYADTIYARNKLRASLRSKLGIKDE